MKICLLSFLAVDEALYKAPAVDEDFQELTKDIHESNRNISNPYEHEDTEQYNSAFDSLLSDEKRELIARSKRLIRLIKSGDPPKNYVERRANKLREDPRDDNMGSGTTSVHGFYGTTVEEYDEFAIFDLEQFVEDITQNNTDKHIVGLVHTRTFTLTMGPVVKDLVKYNY
jgi:sigma54-dependent transcription regulator